MEGVQDESVNEENSEQVSIKELLFPSSKVKLANDATFPKRTILYLFLLAQL